MTDMINTDPFLLFFGSFYIVLGLSVFLATKSWEDFMDIFIENKAVSLVLGILTLPIALFVMVFYDTWDTIGSIILMAIGYLMFIKALILLLRPSLFQNMLSKEFVRKWLWLDGLSGIALGAAMLIL